MDPYHYILGLMLIYAIMSILVYKEELKNKERQLNFKEEQIEDLRKMLRTYIKEGNKR